MIITIEKITSPSLARRACEFTVHKEVVSNIKMDTLYRCEHSPVRTQMFWVEMLDIPSFVSTHLVRHKIGVEHFVQTNRDDRGAEDVADRNTPVRHAMFINSQSLINLARKRLCIGGAHERTREVIQYLKDEVAKVDPDLARYMVVDCEYRGGCCEPRCCGYMERKEYA